MLLSNMDSKTLNEVEKAEAIRLCMRHMVAKQNNFEEMMDQSEYVDKGRGWDLYLMHEYKYRFHEVNTNLGLLEIQAYIAKTLARGQRASHINPAETPIFEGIED